MVLILKQFFDTLPFIIRCVCVCVFVCVSECVPDHTKAKINGAKSFLINNS